MSSVTQSVIKAVNQIILGKDQQIRLAFSCFLAKGHLLIEDMPGMGKTTLAHALAHVLGLRFNRIQFTSDLLPADVIGVSVYDRNTSSFKFHQGPVFSQLLLADEINRATPKTQSALLEAMEESQISIEGDTHPLPEPFFVIATQNPKHHIGTFPLPESQLDRFLMRISLGYPDPASERLLLKNQAGRQALNTLSPVCDLSALHRLQTQVEEIHVDDKILDYILAIVQFTRTHYTLGLSPRAAQGLKRCAQAWAMCHDRNYVIPEDIQAILPSIIMHRLPTQDEDAAQHILDQVMI